MKIQTAVSKLSKSHWFFNDIVLFVLFVSAMISLVLWILHNQDLRIRQQCPAIAEKFHFQYQITRQGCNIQTPTGDWVGVRID